MRARAFIALLVGLVLGAGGASVGWRLSEPQPTPSLYTNANGTDALRHPSRHIEAAVQYRGTVVGAQPLSQGEVVALRVDGMVVAAHVYDRSWTPAYAGQPLEVQGRIRGTLGDPIDAPEIPVTGLLRGGMTLIDVSSAVGPHRLRLVAPGAPRQVRSSDGRGAPHRIGNGR